MQSNNMQVGGDNQIDTFLFTSESVGEGHPGELLGLSYLEN